MKTFNKLCFFFASVLLLVSGSSAAQVCSTVIMSGPPASAPSSWVSDGKLGGASVEFIERIGREAGFQKIDFRVYPSWADALDAGYRGEVDALFSVNWSEERERYLDYVRPAMTTQFLQVVVRRGETFTLNKLDDLIGRTGGAYVSETYGNGFFGNFVEKNLKLIRVPSYDKAADLLLGKEVDYIFGYENAMYELIMVRNLGVSIQVLNTYPTRTEGFLAFSKRSKCNDQMREKFAKQLAQEARKPNYDVLLRKYREVFNENLTRPN